MMAVVPALVGLCGGWVSLLPQICSCLCKQRDYIINIDKKFSELGEKLQTLHSVRDDINLESQWNETIRIQNQIKDWIRRVTQIDSELEKLEAKYTKRSCGGRCPRRCRLFLSKKMEKLTIKITSLTDEGKGMKKDIELVEPIPSRVETICASEVKQIFNKQPVTKVMRYLEDDTIKRIGIHGLTGTGKTCVLREVNNAQAKCNMFQIVIWVNVKSYRTIEDVQEQIVDRLKLNVEGINNIEVIARKINAKLHNKKYLLLLDDVLERFDLEDVGVYDNDKGSKVVLTTLYRDMCTQMKTTEQFMLDKLSPKAAYNFFMNKIGAIARQPHLKSLAEGISKECGGHMGLIAVVASSLKVDDEDLWRSALKTLTESDTHGEISYMNEMRQALKFSYEQLKEDYMKNCFLYGALYPEDNKINVNYLIECWRAQGFIVLEHKDAWVMGKRTLQILIDKCLLENNYSLPGSSRVKWVKMPRFLRNFALSIGSPNDYGANGRLLIRPREELEKTDEEEWKNTIWISLMQNQLSSLPTNPECDNLSTLLLQSNATLKKIPVSFFNNMGSLVLLDLYGTGIDSLPQSLFSLTNLKGLYLNACSCLEELPTEISNLINLELLDIRHTMIRHLPIELQQLASRLRCLRVSFNKNNGANGTHYNIQEEMIPQGLLSKLCSLQELKIHVVDLQDQRWKQIVLFLVENVVLLNKLNNLQFYFPTVESLKLFVEKRNISFFRFFNFVVGSHDISVYHSHVLKSSELIERYLRFSAGNGIPAPVMEVLKEVDALELVNLQNVAELSEDHTNEMGGLRICVIKGCSDMVCFISYRGIGNAEADGVLESLVKLELINLLELKSIWKGYVQPKTFGNLRTLTLKGCAKLEKIFSQGLISELRKLEELTVEDCAGIKEIINESDNPILEYDTLPALHSLVLVKLPQLDSIWKDASLNWQSLERIEIWSCDKLKKLPFERNSASNLSIIECERTWWSALDWTDVTDEAKDRLGRLSCLN